MPRGEVYEYIPVLEEFGRAPVLRGRATTIGVGGPAEGLARLERAAETGEIDALCERFGVRLLTVFGSTARGEPAPNDLDVGVLFEHGVRPDVLGLIADLTDLAGTDVDLAHLDRAGPVLRAPVRREAQRARPRLPRRRSRHRRRRRPARDQHVHRVRPAGRAVVLDARRVTAGEARSDSVAP